MISTHQEAVCHSDTNSSHHSILGHLSHIYWKWLSKRSQFLDHLPARNCMYIRENWCFLPKSNVLPLPGHKETWQSQHQENSKFSAGHNVNVIAHTCIGRNFKPQTQFSWILIEKKNPTQIFEHNSIKTLFSTPFVLHSLVHHIIHQRIRVNIFPTKITLNG